MISAIDVNTRIIHAEDLVRDLVSMIDAEKTSTAEELEYRINQILDSIVEDFVRLDEEN